MAETDEIGGRFYELAGYGASFGRSSDGVTYVMDMIFQNELPPELCDDVTLPGISPCAPEDWLRVDEAYGEQMAYRAKLIAEKQTSVLWLDEAARSAANELLQQVLGLLPKLGFEQGNDVVRCPDGRNVQIDTTAPLWTLGHLVQEDLCIMERRGAEHVLTGAVLCFPASWTLAHKVGKPLVAIHDPVDEYDAPLAQRVQRMFDGVKVGKPLTRHNRLSYATSDLHQPERRDEAEGKARFLRSERQCIVRLPKTNAVVFSIHTWIVRH